MSRWLVLFFSGSVWAAPAQRSVEIEWERDPSAKNYIVEIRRQDGVLLKSFTSGSATLRFRAPVGEFEIRAQVETSEGRKGPFSAWQPLKIAPREVEFPSDFPPQKTAQIRLGQNKAPVTLSWPAEPTARAYSLKVYRSDGTLLLERTTKDAAATLLLPPGEFSYSVTSLAGKGFISEEVKAPQSVTVSTQALPPLQVAEPRRDAQQLLELSWKALPGVSYSLRLEHMPFLGETWTQIHSEVLPPHSRAWKSQTRLKPGQYRIHLLALLKDQPAGEAVTKELIVKPQESDLAGFSTVSSP